MNRRDVLRSLLALPWVAGGSCRRGNWFSRERVCVHVYRPALFLSPPLQETGGDRRGGRGPGTFNAGLPELVVCTVPGAALDSFPYFWPLSENELRAFEGRITVRWALDSLETDADLQRLQQALRSSDPPQQPGEHLVVLFTMNQYTGAWASAVAAVCRDGDVNEMVVFKDPTVPPYLCDYPALQKGFRRPPP